MEKSLSQVIAQLTTFVQGLSLKQKATLAVGAVLIGATLSFFVHVMNKPELKTLYSGLKPEEAKSIASRLEGKKISCAVSSDGTSISVPADQLDAARLEVVSEGVPHSGRMGFEIFDKPDWTADDFTEKVNYQRALEGELERTIQTLSEVESARVHLVLPGDSIFIDEQRDAKAAVTLKLRGGRYTDETAKAVSRLIASAVDRLRPENVTVVDADTNRSLGGRAGISVSRDDLDLEQQLAERLVKTLEPVIGPERVRASVRVEYDATSTEENQETYDPNSAVAVTTQKSEENVGSERTGGIPGTASNVPGSQTAQAAGGRSEDGSQSSRSESGTYLVSKILRHTTLPAGRVKRIAAALVVDDAVEMAAEGAQKKETRRKRTADELKQIEEIAKAAIGIDPARGDILSVQNLSFVQQSEEKPSKPGVLEKTRRIANDYSALFRFCAIAALFLVTYLLLLRPVKKQILSVLLNGGHMRRKLPDQSAAWDKDGASQIEANATNLGDLPADTRRTVALKQHLLEKVKNEPVGASRLVQSWIRQGKAE